MLLLYAFWSIGHSTGVLQHGMEPIIQTIRVLRSKLSGYLFGRTRNSCGITLSRAVLLSCRRKSETVTSPNQLGGANPDSAILRLEGSLMTITSNERSIFKHDKLKPKIFVIYRWNLQWYWTEVECVYMRSHQSPLIHLCQHIVFSNNTQITIRNLNPTPSYILRNILFDIQTF